MGLSPITCVRVARQSASAQPPNAKREGGQREETRGRTQQPLPGSVGSWFHVGEVSAKGVGWVSAAWPHPRSVSPEFVSGSGNGNKEG